MHIFNQRLSDATLSLRRAAAEDHSNLSNAKQVQLRNHLFLILYPAVSTHMVSMKAAKNYLLKAMGYMESLMDKTIKNEDRRKIVQMIKEVNEQESVYEFFNAVVDFLYESIFLGGSKFVVPVNRQCEYPQIVHTFGADILDTAGYLVAFNDGIAAVSSLNANNINRTMFREILVTKLSALPNPTSLSNSVIYSKVIVWLVNYRHIQLDEAKAVIDVVDKAGEDLKLLSDIIYGILFSEKQLQ